jgi:hypothetical protein
MFLKQVNDKTSRATNNQPKDSLRQTQRRTCIQPFMMCSSSPHPGGATNTTTFSSMEPEATRTEQASQPSTPLTVPDRPVLDASTSSPAQSTLDLRHVVVDETYTMRRFLNPQSDEQGHNLYYRDLPMLFLTGNCDLSSSSHTPPTKAVAGMPPPTA